MSFFDILFYFLYFICKDNLKLLTFNVWLLNEVVSLVRHLDCNEAKLSATERSHTFALAKVNVSQIHKKLNINIIFDRIF